MTQALTRGVRVVATMFHCNDEWLVRGTLDDGFFFADRIDNQRCPTCRETSRSYIVEDAPLPVKSKTLTNNGENHD